jgi:hypothetical protein
MTTNPRTIRSRLTRLRDKLEDFEWKLEHMHADGSGIYRLYRPLPPLFRAEIQPALAGIARTEREALAGCLVSANWLCDTAELRARVEYLNNKPLKERDPAYAGPLNLSPTRFPPRPGTRHAERLAKLAEIPIPTTEAEVGEAARDFELEDVMTDKHFDLPRWAR